LDQVRNEDLVQQTGDDRGDAERARDFRIVGVFGKTLCVLGRLSLAVAILVDFGDKDLVEQRVALAADLFEAPIISIVIGKTWVRTAGRRIDAGALGGLELRKRNVQHDGVDVETALAVERLGRGVTVPPKGELQIEDGLDVTIKAVVALPGEGQVAALKFE